MEGPKENIYNIYNNIIESEKIHNSGNYKIMMENLGLEEYSTLIHNTNK